MAARCQGLHELPNHPPSTTTFYCLREAVVVLSHLSEPNYTSPGFWPAMDWLSLAQTSFSLFSPLALTQREGYKTILLPYGGEGSGSGGGLSVGGCISLLGLM